MLIMNSSNNDGKPKFARIIVEYGATPMPDTPRKCRMTAIRHDESELHLVRYGHSDKHAYDIAYRDICQIEDLYQTSQRLMAKLFP